MSRLMLHFAHAPLSLQILVGVLLLALLVRGAGRRFLAAWPLLQRGGTLLGALGLVLLAYGVLDRGLEVGRVPILTPFEGLLSFALAVGLLNPQGYRGQAPLAPTLLVQLGALVLALLQPDLELLAGPTEGRGLGAWIASGLLLLGLGALTQAWLGALVGLSSRAETFQTWLVALRRGTLLLGAGLLSSSLWTWWIRGVDWAWNPLETWGMATLLACLALAHAQRVKGYPRTVLLGVSLGLGGLVAGCLRALVASPPWNP